LSVVGPAVGALQLFITLLDSEKFNALYREIFSSFESRESR